MRAPVLAGLLVLLAVASAGIAEPPRTVAERTDFQATSRHADVLAFCEQLAKESPVVRLSELGTSFEGRKLPLLILADPPLATAEEAKRSNKLIVFAMGNIHAGEVDGKEALLMLARDIATAKEQSLLKGLVLVFAPIFNADGNEKMANNRPSQAGPPLVGTRANGQELDLNRDFIKLESPEVRALVKFLNDWNPAVFIDLHTTNGSHHRYTLTYEGGRCPAGDPRLITFTRDDLLPEVGRRMETSTGYRSFFYGIMSSDRRRWEPVSPTPRFGWHYVGLRNRIAILSESYSYAPFKDRTLASKSFVRTICEYTAENNDRIRKLLSEARETTLQSGREPNDKNSVVLQHKLAVLGRPITILGFVEETRNGRRVATEKPQEYEVDYLGGVAPTLLVRRPFAYLLPADLKPVIANLRAHGVETDTLHEATTVAIETYRIDKITRSPAFQKHQPVSVEVTRRTETRRIDAGTIIVRTAQPLGSLAVQLLEPQSSDGLVTWNFFDDVMKEGSDFPVVRVPSRVTLK